MTFPIPQGRGDPRVLCGMLAEQALVELNAAQQQGVPDMAATICLMNLMRLLERYRHGVMHVVSQPVGILEGGDEDPFTWVAPEEDPMQSLQGFLVAAQTQVFGAGSDKGEVVTTVRRVLRRRLKGLQQSNAQEANHARDFLLALVNQIDPA